MNQSFTKQAQWKQYQVARPQQPMQSAVRLTGRVTSRPTGVGRVLVPPAPGGATGGGFDKSRRAAHPYCNPIAETYSRGRFCSGGRTPRDQGSRERQIQAKAKAMGTAGKASAPPVFTFSSDGRENRALSALRKKVVPALTPSQHKGESGRILVIGGSQSFTGAPFFAASASLNCGADLAYIACSSDAATPIKTYSPELIVMPLLSLQPSDLYHQLVEPVKKAHCIVIGPGLGRDQSQIDSAKIAIELARSYSVPVVLDADALWLLLHDFSLAKGHACCVITPNAVELQRLLSAASLDTEQVSDKVQDDSRTHQSSEARQIAALSCCLGGATVVKKGREDIIAEGTNFDSGHLLRCGMFGSPRRCGGQGDILCGSIATFLAWAAGLRHKDTSGSARTQEGMESSSGIASGDAGAATAGGGNTQPSQQQASASSLRSGTLAAFGGCVIVRRAAQLAFAKRGRATGTGDVLAEVSHAMDELFPLEPLGADRPPSTENE